MTKYTTELDKSQFGRQNETKRKKNGKPASPRVTEKKIIRECIFFLHTSGFETFKVSGVYEQRNHIKNRENL